MQKIVHDVTATVRHDTSDIQTLSTNSDPETNNMVTRKMGKGREETDMSCPTTIMNYTSSVDGIILADQKRKYYGIKKTSKECWKCFPLCSECSSGKLVKLSLCLKKYYTMKTYLLLN
jgi:hypothetical protein